jgi:hypothetical protein
MLAPEDETPDVAKKKQNEINFPAQKAPESAMCGTVI